MDQFYMKYKLRIIGELEILVELPNLNNSGAPTTVLLRGSGNTMTKISEAEQHYEPTTR